MAKEQKRSELFEAYKVYVELFTAAGFKPEYTSLFPIETRMSDNRNYPPWFKADINWKQGDKKIIVIGRHRLIILIDVSEIAEEYELDLTQLFTDLNIRTTPNTVRPGSEAECLECLQRIFQAIQDVKIARALG